jgi:hypothetical protein
MKLCPAAVALLLAPVPLMAQSSPDGLREMQTDRPNATNSPTTIDPSHLQLEVGAFDTSIDRQGGDRDREWSLGELNFRVGVLSALELNVLVQPRLVSAQRVGGVSMRSRGFGDLTIGGKFNFWGNDGGATALGIQPQVKLPTAANGLGNGHAEFSVGLPFTAKLPAGFDLSLQPTLSRVRNEDNTRTVTGYQGAAAIDHDLGPINLYAEYVYDDTSEHGAPNRQTLDLGGVLKLSRNLVLDSGVFIGLNHATPDLEITTGGSVRF